MAAAGDLLQVRGRDGRDADTRRMYRSAVAEIRVGGEGVVYGGLFE